MSHQQLIVEVNQQIKMFRPDVKQIKRQIETLIDREFLERDEANTSILKYIA
jgi:cullin 1